MKNKRMKLILAIFLAGSFTNVAIVQADDDDYKYKKYEKHHEEDDDDDRYEYDYEDDDDDYEEEQYDSYDVNVVQNEKGTWNIWTRALVGEKGTLPFTESKKVTIKIADTNETANVYVVPKDGEVFVPGKTLAKLLGEKATFYKISKILTIQSGENQLIFRSGTNVVYENNVKTPLPANAFYLNEDVYVPISVLTNGLGYAVKWQENEQTLLCQPLT